MGIETASYISELVGTNPVGAVDDYATADDHLRLIKNVLQGQFPNFTAAAMNASVIELNLLVGLTATAVELNKLDGYTGSTAELNNLDGYTGNTADLNILSGADAGGLTAAELLYLADVTSAIQAQLDGKAASSHNHAAVDVNSGTFVDARIAASNVTQHVAVINHNALLNYAVAQHIDWALTGAEDVHVDRIAAGAVTQHEAAIDHDALSGSLANEHIDHTGVTITDGSGLSYSVGGTDISADATLDLDISAIATMEGNALAATDRMYVRDGGVNKAIEVQAAGMRVQLAQTTQTLAAADMNSIMEFLGTGTLTLPLNATVALPIGVPIVLNVKHATQVLTVTAAASVTLVSTFHPAGAVAASDIVLSGGTALLYKTAADVWALSGDTDDS